VSAPKNRTSLGLTTSSATCTPQGLPTLADENNSTVSVSRAQSIRGASGTVIPSSTAGRNRRWGLYLLCYVPVVSLMLISAGTPQGPLPGYSSEAGTNEVVIVVSVQRLGKCSGDSSLGRGKCRITAESAQDSILIVDNHRSLGDNAWFSGIFGLGRGEIKPPHPIEMLISLGRRRSTGREPEQLAREGRGGSGQCHLERKRGTALRCKLSKGQGLAEERS